MKIHKHVDRNKKRIASGGYEWTDHTCTCGMWLDWKYKNPETNKWEKVDINLL